MIESECTFGDVGTHRDWGCRLISVETQPPEPKTVTVEVPGADGVLDLTEALTGGVTYGERVIDVRLSRECRSRLEAVGVASRAASDVHGKRLRIRIPDRPSAFFVGRCEVSHEIAPSHRLVLSVRAKCDPFAYAGEGSAELAPTQPSVSRGLIAHPAPSFALGAGSVEARFAKPRHYTTVSRAIRLYAAGGRNLLDLSQCSVRLLAAEGGSSPRGPYSWTPSGVMRQSGQRVSMGRLSKAWAHRVAVAVDARPDWGVSFPPAFPFTGGGLYLTAFVTGRVKSVGSDPSDGNQLMGFSLGVHDASGRAMPDGTRQMSWSTSKYLVPKPGSSLVDAAVTIEVQREFNLIVFDANWVEAEEMGVAFELSEEPPSRWEAADVRFSQVGLPSPFQTTGDGATDSYSANAVSASLDKACYQTSEPHVARRLDKPRRVKAAAPSWPSAPVSALCAVPVGESGQLMPCVEVAATSYPLAEASVSNGPMKSTPSVTCADPVVVVDGGRPVVTPPGKSQLLPVTLEAGKSSIRYAVVGSRPATLTWGRGEL